jgi:predicted hydrocarbon binding protein
MLKDYIPNSLMYISLLSIKDILGDNGFNALLNYSDLKKYRDKLPPNDDKLEIPGTDFTKLNIGVIDIFGEKGARPLLYNAGRRGFQIILEENPSLFGLVGLGLKVLSKRNRLDKLFRTSSNETNKLFGENQRYYSNEEGFISEIYDCFWCKGVKSKGPICFAELGWNAEAAKWATGDEHEVKEVLCKAKGDDICKIVISLEPKK